MKVTCVVRRKYYIPIEILAMERQDILPQNTSPQQEMISNSPYVHSHWPENVLKWELAKSQAGNVKKG